MTWCRWVYGGDDPPPVSTAREKTEETTITPIPLASPFGAADGQGQREGAATRGVARCTLRPPKEAMHFAHMVSAQGRSHFFLVSAGTGDNGCAQWAW